MHPQKMGARAEYQLLEGQRVRESDSLAEKFKKLKSLTVEFTFLSSATDAQNTSVKYSVNLDNAKSVFRLNCPNHECVRGDFDLTKLLARAVAKRAKQVTGEMACQGWRNRQSIRSHRCDSVLRYKLRLGY